MIRDILELIFLYVDIDQYYLLKDEYNLDVLHYCNNVDLIPSGKEESYLRFLNTFVVYQTIIRESVFADIDWAYFMKYDEIVDFLHARYIKDTKDSRIWNKVNNNLNIKK